MSGFENVHENMLDGRVLEDQERAHHVSTLYKWYINGPTVKVYPHICRLLIHELVVYAYKRATVIANELVSAGVSQSDSCDNIAVAARTLPPSIARLVDLCGKELLTALIDIQSEIVVVDDEEHLVRLIVDQFVANLVLTRSDLSQQFVQIWDMLCDRFARYKILRLSRSVRASAAFITAVDGNQKHSSASTANTRTRLTAEQCILVSISEISKNAGDVYEDNIRLCIQLVINPPPTYSYRSIGESVRFFRWRWWEIYNKQFQNRVKRVSVDEREASNFLNNLRAPIEDDPAISTLLPARDTPGTVACTVRRDMIAFWATEHLLCTHFLKYEDVCNRTLHSLNDLDRYFRGAYRPIPEPRLVLSDFLRELRSRYRLSVHDSLEDYIETTRPSLSDRCRHLLSACTILQNFNNAVRTLVLVDVSFQIQPEYNEYKRGLSQKSGGLGMWEYIEGAVKTKRYLEFLQSSTPCGLSLASIDQIMSVRSLNAEAMAGRFRTHKNRIEQISD